MGNLQPSGADCTCTCTYTALRLKGNLHLHLHLHCTTAERSSIIATRQITPWPRHTPWRGTAAPTSVARQARPRQRSAIPVAATSARCRATMHGAAQAFGRARAIGAAKSVSFFKKPTVLDLKLISKKC